MNNSIKLSTLIPSSTSSSSSVTSIMTLPTETRSDSIQDCHESLLTPEEGTASRIQLRGKYDTICFGIAFFLFGLLNNVLYVIIISAALDLVPAEVPTGVILMADITPSLLIKIGWPYLVSGQVRYTRRVISCSAISFMGMIVIVAFPSITMRLLGISLASVSSGLGEMTFLQLSTTYPRRPGVSWFASGTGAAGVFGAGFWWMLRDLGIKTGLGLSSILPLCLSLAYLFLLPPSSEDLPHHLNNHGYEALTATEDGIEISSDRPKNALSLRQKLELTRPLILPFMLPLFSVYFAEYSINTGIAPTLLYPLPTPEQHLIFSHIFKSLRDYYPFWQLTYQIFVFFSRSSMAIFRFPPLPKRLIPLPSLVQVLLFCIVLLESSYEILTHLFDDQLIYTVIFGLITLEGICGGLAYVSAYHWLSMEAEEQEFKMGCVGFSDTIGILVASIFSSWLQPRLCGIQVSQGRTLCRDVGKLSGSG